MRNGSSAARRLLSLTLGRGPGSTEGERRHVRVAQGALAALGARGVGILVGLATVPLAVSYLGSERYGAWMTISATLAWFQIADLGIGNGLTNALVEAQSHDQGEVARRHVATAFWLLAAIAVAFAGALALAWPWLDWGAVFGIHSALARAEISRTVAVAALLYLLAFPLNILDRIYAALQEGSIGNGWSTAISVVTLGAVIAATRTQGGLVVLALATSGAQFVGSLANATWLFLRHRPDLRPRLSAVSRASFSRIARDGWRFFAIQVAGVVLFGTDNLIITHVLGPEQVTPYSVTWRLFAVCTMLVGLYFPYLWPAYGEAFARGDAAWIRRTLGTSLKWTVGVAASISAVLVVLGTPIIRLWAGPASVPPFGVLVWMAAWTVLSTAGSAVACLLNAAGQLTGQIVYGTLAALANVALSIVLGRIYGLSGVIAATVIAYVTFLALPVSLEVRLVLRRLHRDDSRRAERR